MFANNSLFTLFVVVFLSSITLTVGAIKILPKFGLLDIPSKRRAHQHITPRGGGIVFVIIYCLSMVLNYYLPVFKNFSYLKLLLPFILISLISFIDDIKNVSVGLRFVIYIFSATLAYYYMLYPNKLFNELFLFADAIIVILGLTFFINIYNFLDGVDGLTAIESIHLSIAILALTYLQSDIILHRNFVLFTAIITLSFSCSFLIFNWNPAKIFIGDVGTISLGFLIGTCLMLLSASSLKLFLSSIIASLYYLMDGGITILIRLLNKEKIWQPHLKHFFQKALRKGWHPKTVVFYIGTTNITLLILALIAQVYPIISISVSIILVGLLLLRFS